jgi:hypothetical protein
VFRVDLVELELSCRPKVCNIRCVRDVWDFKVFLFFFDNGAKAICNANCGTVGVHQILKYEMITKKQNSAAKAIIEAELGFVSVHIYMPLLFDFKRL